MTTHASHVHNFDGLGGVCKCGEKASVTTHASQREHDRRISILEAGVETLIKQNSKLAKQLKEIKLCHEKMKTELETLKVFTPSESL